MGHYLFKFRRLLLHHILHTDDTPNSIALGVAIATVIAFLPLIGFQTAIAIGLAVIFRANKAVCIPIVWITNPFTLVPIYGACLALGRFVMASPYRGDEAVLLSTFQVEQEPGGFFSVEFWQSIFHRLTDFGIELWVGCAIVGVVFAIASYVLSRWGVVAYRERRRKKLLKRSLFQSTPQRTSRASQRRIV